MSGHGDADGGARSSTLVVVPTYDEAANLATLLDLIALHLPEADVLVVDDSSPDGTGALAEKLATTMADTLRIDVLHRPSKSGLGSAYRDGFQWGLDRGYDRFVEMDADLSHPAAVLPRLVGGLDAAHLVIGARYIPGGDVENWPKRRQLLSRGANVYVRLLTGLPVHDATSGFRAFRREALEAIRVTELRSDGYAFQIEAALRVWEAGMEVVEVPITFRDRTAGQSKLTGHVVREALLAVPRWGRRSRGRRRAATAG